MNAYLGILIRFIYDSRLISDRIVSHNALEFGILFLVVLLIFKSKNIPMNKR